MCKRKIFLKLTKFYLRSIMSQERLNELFILSIQNEILVELEYRNLISKLICISNTKN